MSHRLLQALQLLGATVALLLVAPVSAHAQVYPERAVKIIVV